MALSDYDTAAVSLDGEMSDGVYTSPLGVTVRIYKEHLYIEDPKAWAPGGMFIEPVVGQIEKGDLYYKDVRIFAMPGEHRGVCAAVWSMGKVDEVLGFVGVGHYGWLGTEWVGVTPAHIEWFRGKLNESVTEEYSLDLGPDREPFRSTDTRFLIDVPPRVRAAMNGTFERFNQGDKYFSDRLGTVLPSSAPGEAEGPLLMALLKGEVDTARDSE